MACSSGGSGRSDVLGGDGGAGPASVACKEGILVEGYRRDEHRSVRVSSRTGIPTWLRTVSVPFLHVVTLTATDPQSGQVVPGVDAMFIDRADPSIAYEVQAFRSQRMPRNVLLRVIQAT